MPPEQSPKPDAPQALKRIRTFQSDVEELMQREQTSKADIALAQNEKKLREETASTETAPPIFKQSKVFSISNALPLSRRWNVRRITLITVGFLVIVGIGVGAFYLFRGAKPAAPVLNTKPKQTAGIELGTGAKRAGALSAIRKAIQALSIPQNELRPISLQRGGAVLTTGELFAVLEANPPPELERALGSSPTFGLYGFKGGQPFLLFGVTSYDRAFAGMLSWEQTLLSDIGPLFGVSSRDILKNTGSTTKEAVENVITIKDAIIRNKDARAAFDPQGVIVFLYSFIDKQTLVFTTDEDMLKALIAKAGGGSLK